MASPRFILKTELTGLEPVTVGGAAVGGVIGNQIKR